MNSGKRSNSNSSKNSLQQKKLEYFGITNNFVQGKGKSTASHTGENVAQPPGRPPSAAPTLA